jgi:hypothetical protein
MLIPESILNSTATFDAEWRHPRLPPLEYSEIYSLFPE